MRNTTQVDRKPTAPQARWIREAIDGQGAMAGVFRIGIPERSRQIMIQAGWLVEVDTPNRHFTSEDRVTDAGRMAVGRADTIAIPDVQHGDVLVYRTHPGHSFRVTEILANKYGQAFRGVTLTVDAESGESDARVGRNEHTAEFDVQAYQVRPARPSEVAAEVFHVNDRWRAGETDKTTWTDADYQAYAAHVQARTAKRKQAQAEMDAAQANQQSPAYQVFHRALLAGKSYRAAMDILHTEAVKMEAAEVSRTEPPMSVCDIKSPHGRHRIGGTWRTECPGVDGNLSPVVAAAARTGATGARTLIPTGGSGGVAFTPGGRPNLAGVRRPAGQAHLRPAEAADVAEGQVLAGVAQARRVTGCTWPTGLHNFRGDTCTRCGAPKCPPLCDASAVLHIVPGGMDRMRPFDIAPLRPSDVGDAWPASGFSV